MLVQPYDDRVEDGETALVFLGGRQSHAFTKGPILPPPGRRPVFDESGTYAEESLTPADPTSSSGTSAMRRWPPRPPTSASTRTDFLYARVDVIGGPDDPQLLELELVEPSLGWRQLDATTRARQQREFALGVESALDRLGLGPLSHRRP